jgi:hypothetical protein
MKLREFLHQRRITQRQVVRMLPLLHDSIEISPARFCAICEGRMNFRPKEQESIKQALLYLGCTPKSIAKIKELNIEFITDVVVGMEADI